jgi:iron(III) transport system ATP-binding protein
MLEVSRLYVDYQLAEKPYRAVNDVSFTVAAGEFFTLLGPSGCGKTTTLRSIAGLEMPTGGTIRIDGQPVFSAQDGMVVPTQRRDIAMVFQSYAIWPHMTVCENVAFPLSAQGMNRSAARAKVAEVLRLVGLIDYIDRPATQLSGGQQQRVAVARAIVKNAKVILLDEPLSNLDAKLREQMRQELRGLQRQVGTTAIYVTHDQEEALSLSDRIAVMSAGKIVEIGSPVDLYLRPRHPFTARFIGQANLLACTVLGRTGAGVRVKTAAGDLVAGVHADLADTATHVLVRPECIQFVDGAAPSGNVFEGTIRTAVFSGKTVEYEVGITQGGTLTVQAPPTAIRAQGDRALMHVAPERCVLLSKVSSAES